MSFVKATKHQAKLRMALVGPAGSGKTYTALKLATLLGQRVALIDTERGSACHYANEFEFDTCELDTFSPPNYVAAIHEAEGAGYDVIIVDSLSQAWSGKDGALELVDKAAKRSQSGNSFAAWREVTPLHNQLVDAMVSCRAHIIVTMRTKMDYVQEKDDKGRTVIRKVGLQPVQRDGLEYEFDVVADMNIDHDFIVSKTRCKELTGEVVNKPGENIASILRAWLSDTQPRPEQPVTANHTPSAPQSNGHKPDVPMATAEQIKAVHIAAKNVGLDEAAYRAELQRRFGVDSSKKLTAEQARELLGVWKTKPTPPQGRVVEEPLPWREPAQANEQATYTNEPFFYTGVPPQGVSSALWGQLGKLCEEAKAAGVTVKDWEPKTAETVGKECVRLRKAVDTVVGYGTNKAQEALI